MDILPNTPAGIGRACDALRTGKLVIWPSPLWYGLSTTALDPAAVCRLYRAKRRDARKALLLLTQGAEDAERYGWINPVAAQLIEAFWPGFLGVIVEKRTSVPDVVTAGRETVLLACIPDLGYALAQGADGPIVASSTNRTGTPPALDMTDVDAFAQQADEPIDAVIEGGISPWNRPTTIVDTCATSPVIVRAGIVDERAIRKVIPDVLVKPTGCATRCTFD